MLKASPWLIAAIPKCHHPPTAISLHTSPSTAALNNFRLPLFRSIRSSLPIGHFQIAAFNHNHHFPNLDDDDDDDNGSSGDDEDKVLAETSSQEDEEGDGEAAGWLPALPHVLTASMSNFLFGYHIGVMNGPIVSIAKELGFEGNSFLEGLVVSIFIGGAFIGSVGCGSLIDKLGCRRTFQLDTIPLILGAIISAQAHSLEEMLCGRFLVGLGIGVNTVLVPIYISEVAPTKFRGSLGTLSQIGTCLGIIVSLFLGIPSENDPHWWRTMLYMASIPGFILALGMQFAVESPRWLCKAGKLDDAKEVICNLWGLSKVEKAIGEFQSVIRNDGADLDSSWLELLEEPHSRAAFIGGALFILQQFAGINGVLYFSSLTFQDVGITSGALASFYLGVTNFAGALCASYLMDKQGRQVLLIGSYLGMALSMFVAAGSISFSVDTEISNNLSILGTLMYIYSFAIGAGPVTGLIIPELSSSRTRGKILGFSFCVHWVFNFLVGLFFLELVERFGVAPVYAGFGGVSLLAAAFSYYFIVETKGRSLEEIEFFLELVERFGVAPVYAGFGGVSLLAAAFSYYFIVETKGRSLEEIEVSLNSNHQGRNGR